MGIILFTLVCGKLPFNGKTVSEITTAIKECNPRIPVEEGVRISYELRNLLGRLITYPEYRIKMDEIMEHPWLKGEKIVRYTIFFFRYNSSKRDYRRRRKITRRSRSKVKKAKTINKSKAKILQEGLFHNS
jgi:serine/threonine protein kinase